MYTSVSTPNIGTDWNRLCIYKDVKNLFGLGTMVYILHSYYDVKISLFNLDPGDCLDCNDYKLLPDEGLRSTQHQAGTSGNYLCDRDLKEGWYRAVISTGGDIATEAPGLLSCGTLFTVWYNGKCYVLLQLSDRLGCGYKGRDSLA